jgi:hypothetical protein
MMILSLHLSITYKFYSNFLDSDNIISDHTFRISSSGILIRKRNVFKFIPTSLNQHYENDFLLCKDEVEVARINLPKKGKFLLKCFIRDFIFSRQK